MITAIITAAGSGSRMKQSGNKIFLRLNGKPALAYSVLAIAASGKVDDLIITVAAGFEYEAENLLSALSLSSENILFCQAPGATGMNPYTQAPIDPEVDTSYYIIRRTIHGMKHWISICKRM